MSEEDRRQDAESPGVFPFEDKPLMDEMDNWDQGAASGHQSRTPYAGGSFYLWLAIGLFLLISSLVLFALLDGSIEVLILILLLLVGGLMLRRK
jgi:hypothetical protein